MFVLLPATIFLSPSLSLSIFVVYSVNNEIKIENKKIRVHKNRVFF